MRNLPGSRTLSSARDANHDRNAQNVRHPKGLRRPVALDQGRCRRDADFGEIDIDRNALAQTVHGRMSAAMDEMLAGRQAAA